MQFLYDIEAKKSILNVQNDNYKHIIKARRYKIGDKVPFRNLIDKNIYYYEISFINKKSAILNLKFSEGKEVQEKKKLHIAWCVIDPKIILKQLPYLNELGVNKITFIFCDYSQKNFKLDLKKFEKVLINSSQQCGRSSIIKLETINSLDTFIEKNPDTYMLNFSQNNIENHKKDIKTIIIGCEGGFSKNEINLLSTHKIVGFNTPLILKSQTAVISVASKIIV